MSVKKTASRLADKRARSTPSGPLSALPQATPPSSAEPISLVDLKAKVGGTWKQHPRMVGKVTSRLESRLDTASVETVKPYLQPNRFDLEIHLVDKQNNRVALQIPGTYPANPQTLDAVMRIMKLGSLPPNVASLVQNKMLSFEALQGCLQKAGYRVEWVAKKGDQCLVLDLARQGPGGLGVAGVW